MNLEQNRAMARKAVIAYQEMANHRNFAPLEECVAANATWHGTTGEIRGMDGFKQATKTAPGRSAFADTRFVVRDLIAEGDKVTVRFTHTAVSVGPFWGRPPTHKTVSWEGIAVYRFEAGRIVETWTNEDSLSLFLQLGILEAPAPAAEPAHSQS